MVVLGQHICWLALGGGKSGKKGVIAAVCLSKVTCQRSFKTLQCLRVFTCGVSPASSLLAAGMIMFASAICVRAGAASQAAFEIIRQAWIISIQVPRGHVGLLFCVCVCCACCAWRLDPCVCCGWRRHDHTTLPKRVLCCCCCCYPSCAFVSLCLLPPLPCAHLTCICLLSSLQLFESLNVAMQAMAAAYLGKHDRSSARAVLVRTLQISTGLGLVIGLLLAAGSHQVVGLFTKDAAVAALACTIMPVIAACMPLDAAASITDGGLIAAGQTNALSVIQVLGTLVQYAVMLGLVRAGLDSVVYVWAVLKVMTLARLGGGLFIHFGSRRSAFRASTPKGDAAASAAGAAEGGGEEEQQPGLNGDSPAASTAVPAPTGSSSGSSSGSSTDGSRSGVLAGGAQGSPSVIVPPPSSPSHQQQQQPQQADWQPVAPPPLPQHQIMMMHQPQQQQPQQQHTKPPLVPPVIGATSTSVDMHMER